METYLQFQLIIFNFNTTLASMLWPQSRLEVLVGDRGRRAVFNLTVVVPNMEVFSVEQVEVTALRKMWNHKYIFTIYCAYSMFLLTLKYSIANVVNIMIQTILRKMFDKSFHIKLCGVFLGVGGSGGLIVFQSVVLLCLFFTGKCMFVLSTSLRVTMFYLLMTIFQNLPLVKSKCC